MNTKEIENDEIESVEAGNDQEKKPPAEDHRDAFMDALASRSIKDRGLDLNQEEDDPEKDDPVKKEEQESKQEQQADKPQPNKQDDDEYVVLKVDGEERKVKKTEAFDAGIRALQKDLSAERRLEEATRKLKEADELLNRVSGRAAAEEQPPSLQDEEIIAQAIREGDMDEAARAIKILRGAENPTPEQLFQEVKAKLAFEDAVKFVQDEYKDILEDPYLRTLMVAKEEEFRNAGDNRSHMELYKSIGDDIRARFGGKKGEDTSKSFQQKREMKSEKVVNLNSASGKKQIAEQPKRLSASEIIEEMRRERHQA